MKARKVKFVGVMAGTAEILGDIVAPAISPAEWEAIWERRAARYAGTALDPQNAKDVPRPKKHRTPKAPRQTRR